MPFRPRRTLPTAVALACLLAAPAAAQDPGDEQYEDPFGSEQPAQPESTPQPRSESTPAPSAPAPAPEEPAQQSPAPAPAPAPATASQAAPQLPNTGAEPGLVGLAGAGLLLAGIGLRLRLRADGDEPVSRGH